MRRQTLNFVVDTLALLLMLSLLSTGLLLRYTLPPGSRGGRGLTVWGGSRHDWGDVHFWIAVGLVAVLVLHVALHWDWVCAVVGRWAGRTPKETAGARWRRIAWGAGLTAASALAVAAFLWLAAGQAARGIEGPDGRGVRAGQGLGRQGPGGGRGLGRERPSEGEGVRPSTLDADDPQDTPPTPGRGRGFRGGRGASEPESRP